MIRINLYGEREDHKLINFIQIVGFLSTMIFLMICCFLFQRNAQTKLNVLEQEKTILNAKASALRKKVEKVEELEKKKKFLAEKLQTIAKLKNRKQTPVKILTDIRESIPERAWLTAIIEKDDTVQCNGIALDPQTVSLFMSSLSASKVFSSVDLNFSREYIKDGVKLQEFQVSAKLSSELILKSQNDDTQESEKVEKKKDKKKKGKDNE